MILEFRRTRDVNAGKENNVSQEYAGGRAARIGDDIDSTQYVTIVQNFIHAKITFPLLEKVS